MKFLHIMKDISVAKECQHKLMFSTFLLEHIFLKIFNSLNITNAFFMFHPCLIFSPIKRARSAQVLLKRKELF